MSSQSIDDPHDAADVAQLLHAGVVQDTMHAHVLLDADGMIRWVNDTAAQLFHLEPAALVGQPLALLFRDDDIERGTVALELETARTRGHCENDRWMRRSDGSAFWATGVTTAIRAADGTACAYHKILRNRTDLREHTVALRNERDALADERDAAVERIAKNVHELRNPLSVIASATEVLRRLAGDEDPRASAAAERVQRQIGQLVRLIDGLMATAEGSQVAQRVEREPVVVQDAIAAALEAVEPSEGRRARVSCLMQAAPVVVDIDPAHLQQILVNLLGNALKYTPDGEPVWVRLSTEAQDAVVRIEDRGAGIAPEALSRIFDLFTRASDVREMPGSGVGLAVVRELVSLYGGSVLAQSEGVGQGAIFTVRLPRCEPGGVYDDAAVLANAASAARPTLAP
ncbi:PAS domain-containing sensor histidine kinase [Cognatilysobacter bugurensis]|uniref:histidine kinase n=1 Tax=Cognatilysobacter bugurensis TaxID=543356 RepID=A0A918W4V7_9GAMM|nr:PAS domain-containing sensor histidine kinase [Lysobacter bugurensis]GHA69136.1 hypothetical protein GCM10007067_01310 [Lysobacter bugurensis]